MMACIRIIQHCIRGGLLPHRLCGEPLLHIAPGHGSSHEFEVLYAFSCISWAFDFRGGGDSSIFLRGLVEAEGGTSILSRRVGSFDILWRTLPLVKKTLHRHRAGIEPQCALPFKKKVKAPTKYSEKPSEPER
jgi:hypothetical protein